MGGAAAAGTDDEKAGASSAGGDDGHAENGFKIRYQVLGSSIKLALVTPNVSFSEPDTTISLGSSPSRGPSPQQKLDDLLAQHGIFIPKPDSIKAEAEAKRQTM